MISRRIIRALVVAGSAASVVILGVLILSAIAIVNGRWTHALAPDVTSAVPILEAPDGPVTLAPGRPGAIVRGEFPLKNNGAAELRFEIAASCGCTDVEPKTGTISPSGSKSIAVSVRLPDVSGGEKAVTLTITSNDSEAPSHRVAAIAKCIVPFRTFPGSINFGRVASDDLATTSRLLTITDAEGKRVSDEMSVSFRSTNGTATLNWSCDSPEECGLRVGITASDLESDARDVLELRMAHSDIPVRVPVYAQIVRPVRLIPSAVFVRPSSDPAQAGSAKVMVVSDRPLGEFATLDAFARIAALDERATSGGHFRTLQVTLTEPLETDRKSLRIKFANYERPLTLTLLSLPKK